MKAKERALELIGKFYYSGIYEYDCKKCALITVNELIIETGKKYWYNVKQEIEKL